jgi:hypothetical protein
MPSPSLDKTYHHPFSTPTPSNAPLNNVGPAHSMHQCCGQTFKSETDFKQHFAAVHEPKSAGYKVPETPKPASGQPPNLTPLTPLK